MIRRRILLPVPLTAGYTIAQAVQRCQRPFSSDSGESPYAGVTVALLKRDLAPRPDKDGKPYTLNGCGGVFLPWSTLGEYTVSVVDPTSVLLISPPSGPRAASSPRTTIAEATVGRRELWFRRFASVGDKVDGSDRDGIQGRR